MPNHHDELQSPLGQSYFDVNGDKELLASSNDECDTNPVTWRGDPIETGSDCTIVVVTSELHAVSYFVHRSIVCFGSRQSKYFAKHLLQQQQPTASTNNSDDGNNCSSNHHRSPSVKVELDQRDAENFPIFLDFMYCIPSAQQQQQQEHQHTNNGLGLQNKVGLSNGTMETAAMSTFSTPSVITTVPTTSSSDDNDGCGGSTGGGTAAAAEVENDVTTDNAVSLRHLARTFENDALIRAANKFIQKDLNFTTGPLYLYKAWQYNDDRLLESSQRLCAENIEHVDMKALIRLPLNLFRVIIKSLETYENENKALSIRLSEIVCRYLEKHPKERTAELLLEFTDPLLMPYIASEAAIGYTAIVKDLEPDDAARHWSSLVRLCRRCAKAVVQEYGWSDFSVNAAVSEYLMNRQTTTVTTTNDGGGKQGKQQRVAAAVVAARQPTNVDSLLFSTSFAAALEQAQEDYEDITTTYNTLETMMTTLRTTITALEAADERKNRYIDKQRQELDKAQNEIIDLKRQIAETMKRQQQQPSHPVVAPPQHRQYCPPTVHPRIQQQPSSSNGMMERLVPGQQHPPVESFRQRYDSPLRRQPPHMHNAPQGVVPPPPPPPPPPAIQHSSTTTSSTVTGTESQCRRRYESPHRLQSPVSSSSASSMSRPPQQHPRTQSPMPPSRGTGTYHHHPQPNQPFHDMIRHEIMQQQHQQQQREPPPDLLEMNFPYHHHGKDLISPTQVGLDVHMNKNRTRQELKTKSEMRSRSLLV